MAVTPDRREEEALWRRGYRRVVGVDEVGRGPLAGPVMAAAVLLPHSCVHHEGAPPWLERVRDSKALTPAVRTRLAGHLRDAGVPLGLGAAEPQEIDQVGIVAATLRAMARAIAQIHPPPDFLLVDGLQAPQNPISHKVIVRGDATCLPIAAASIVAKVARDRLMAELDGRYPGYDFARHKGYPTRAHIEALERLGPSPVHRRYFGPVRRLLEVGHPPDPRARVGRAGEASARRFLEERGYRVEAVNYRCPLGEIDIIAWDRETLVFAEVRTRRSGSFGAPEESVTSAKRRHLIAAAQHYLQERDIAPEWRIDLVIVRPGAVPGISMLQNAVAEEE